MKMIEHFLKAKHWQLFHLTFGIPLIFQLVMTGLMISNFSQPEQSQTMAFSYIKIFPLIMVLFIATLFGWIWSIAIGLQRNVPKEVKMKVRKLKIFFFIPVIYISLVILFVSIVITGNTINPSGGLVGGLFAIVFPLHLFSMFCIFYSIYFAAKTIKTVELQRKVGFADFVGEFFLVWFFPIGIWIIQPKVNKMIKL